MKPAGRSVPRLLVLPAIPAVLGLLALPGLQDSRNARAESVLTLPIPGDRDLPRENIRLELKIPSRLSPAPEPALKEKPLSRTLQTYKYRTNREIPNAGFIYDTLKVMQKKGVFEREMDKQVVREKIPEYPILSRTLARMYLKLVEIYQNRALRKFGLVVEDLERFERVIDLMGPGLVVNNISPVAAAKKIEEMIERVKVASGRGAVRVTGVKEQADGSTLLEMEVQRYDPHQEEN